MATPVIIPSYPNGMNGVQFSGFTYFAPATIKAIITANLIRTIILLMRALSRIPKLKRPVIRSKIQTAGKSMRPPFLRRGRGDYGGQVYIEPL